MTPSTIEEEFRKRVCSQVSLQAEGKDRFRVLTPFRFDDGDHFNVILEKGSKGWTLRDFGATLMHLSYWMDEQDLESGSRAEIVQSALGAHSVLEREGEFLIEVEDENWGEALFDFIQALLRVSDVNYLSRERVRSTFMEDFRVFLEQSLEPRRLTFDWTDPQLDPHALYPVDCRINGRIPQIFVYALPNENRVKDATINLLQFERWGMTFHSVGIFEEQESINPRVLAKFSDVCGKIFSSLSGNRDRIVRHLDTLIANS